jgi:hypothetical protein
MIHNALKTTCDELDTLLKELPLSILNESVFRFFFVRNLLQQRKNCSLQLEWHRFDLLVQDEGKNILIEFKFYTVPTGHNLAGKGTWRKGGPGGKNFEEFKRCVRKLDKVDECAWRRDEEGKIDGKYLILAYEGDSGYHKYYKTINYPGELKKKPVHRRPTHNFGNMICKLIEIR